MKTADLIGPALDWVVAKCEGLNPVPCEPPGFFYSGYESGWYTPSTDWAQGGPIIERERLQIIFLFNEWEARGFDFVAVGCGPTPLIAAMRCFASSKLGYEVDVPEELLK